MAEKYAFLLDLGRCIACDGCVAACKTGNELDAGTQYIRISDVTHGAFPDLKTRIVNHRCYHCQDAACVEVCPTGALFKEDGLTRLNRSACSGCTYCVDACPFDVPRMVDGLSSKCDGCAAVVKAGGTPWCVKTCPSQALDYGPRQDIMAKAYERLSALKQRYPNARIYGETEAGGLGVIMVLPDEPEAMNLPTNPDVPFTMKAWQNVVQPASMAVTGLSALVTGVVAVIARRNHMKELESLHKAEATAAANGSSAEVVSAEPAEDAVNRQVAAAKPTNSIEETNES